MNIIDLPILILDNIISNVNESKTYSSLRISCKSIYYLLKEVKKFHNNKNIKELIIFYDNHINGHHIKWGINGNLLFMGYYINSKKENEQTHYYSSGDIKLIQYYKNDMLNGFEKHYNYDNKLIKKCEYKDNKKINDEIIYSNQEIMIFKKSYINNNIYTLSYYTNYKIISATFIHNLLHGKHITNFLNPNNFKYYRYDKIIKIYDYGVLKCVNVYLNNNIIEKFYINNGKKHDWAFTWYPNNKLKSLCYFNKNEYNKKLKLWNTHIIETIDFANNIPHGNYTYKTKYIKKIIPYVNGLMNGNIIEIINLGNLSYTIKFTNNYFDKIIKTEAKTHKEEIILDIDYFSYTKYSYDKKQYSLKLINDYLNFIVYDINEVPIFTISKILNMFHSTYV